jgi:hypothetical protein
MPCQGSGSRVTAHGFRPEMQIDVHNLLVLQVGYALNTCLYCMSN